MRLNFYAQKKKFTVSEKCFTGTSLDIISTPRPYRVNWETAVQPYRSINKILAENSKNLLFIDDKVYRLHGKKIKVAPDRILKIPATEEFKTLRGVIKIIDFLQVHNITKGHKIVVAGGGIIQDVSAFAAGTFKRGIPWIYFPTTLLSMCDSCIGAKAGVNHKKAKNQICLFSSPAEVILNSVFLKTLPAKDLSSGLGEILKLYLIGGKKFLELYDKTVKCGKVKSINAYKKLLLGSLAVKKAVIECDEFEKEHRKILNYGHTLGHALESMSGYRVSHGQGVALGMLLVNELSFNRGILAQKNRDFITARCLDLLDRKTLEIVGRLNVGKLSEYLKKDKKAVGSSLNFAMLIEPGKTVLLPLEVDAKLCAEIEEIMKKHFSRGR